MKKNYELIKNDFGKFLDDHRSEVEVSTAIPIVLAAIFLKIISSDHDPLIEVPDKSVWNTLVKSKKRGQAMVDAFQSLENHNQRLDGISNLFRKDTFRMFGKFDFFSDVVDFVDDKNLEDVDGRKELIDFLLKMDNDVRSKGYGYITPDSIKRICKNIVGNRKMMKVYDPCIGLSSFIDFSDNEISEVNGQETIQLIHAMSLIVHYLAGHKKLNIVNSDSLKEPLRVKSGELFKFDYVFADPPYNVKFSPEYREFLTTDPDRFSYGTDGYDSNWLFVQHVLKSLKNDGIGIVLVPLGALNANITKNIRDRMVIQGKIKAVIQLPDQLLSTSAIPCGLVVVSHEHTDGKVLMIRASDMGSMKGRNRILSEEEIELISKTYHQREDVKSLSKLITFDEFMTADFNLTPNRYVLTESKISNLDPEKISANINSARVRAEAALARFNKVLNEI